MLILFKNQYIVACNTYILIYLYPYILGSGYSNGVALDVLHPPECAPGQVQLYAVQKHKSIKVLRK